MKSLISLTVLAGMAFLGFMVHEPAPILGASLFLIACLGSLMVCVYWLVKLLKLISRSAWALVALWPASWAIGKVAAEATGVSALTTLLVFAATVFILCVLLYDISYVRRAKGNEGPDFDQVTDFDRMSVGGNLLPFGSSLPFTDPSHPEYFED